MKQTRLFLFASFTASYAAIQKQQSVQLFLGVASGKLHLPSIIIQEAIMKTTGASLIILLRLLMPFLPFRWLHYFLQQYPHPCSPSHSFI